ncbi:uncharacterized protein LOC121737823 isoform X2 [Aricia agestis]|nr:uncharacterized protein LOC121737823 isoform X2 [Aricia agestis]
MDGNFMDRVNRRKRHLDKEDAGNIKESEFKRKKVSCMFCGKNHFNDECDVVKSVQDRKRRLEGRCYVCFSKGHKASDCKSKMKCRHCDSYGEHNRALCPSQLSAKTDSFHVNTSVGRTILQTAVVRVKKIGSDNIYRDCRVLLDCGSQRTYITSKVAKILDLPTLEENRLSVFTFGASHPQEIESPVVNFEIFSKTHYHKVMYANVVPHITNSVPTPNKLWKGDHPKHMIMADDGTSGDQVDILIGNDYYHSIMSHEKIRISEDLYMVNSVLGWIVSGRFNSAGDKVVDKLSCITYFQSSMGCCPFIVPDPPLQSDNIRRLWDLESIGITDSPKASRDEEAIRQFNETTEYIEGRYHVKWPWIDYPPSLPSNFGLACGRLSNLLKRLDNNVLQTYDNLIKEQLSMGIIEFAPNVLPNVEHPVHYLPHHCVAQGEKLRIVYDASAKTKGNKSLNECLYRGPLMLEELTGLLLRFRQHRIGIVADVEKAFLQVGLQDADRDVTRFLWLKDLEGNVSADNLLHFRFCRVPFGIISSPFLLNATVRYHLMKIEIPMLKQIAEDLYVDNLVTGSQSFREGTQLYKVAKKAFDDLSMNLRQWNSNLGEFRETIPSQFLDKETDCIKVLGLQWDLRKDQMRLRFSLEGKDLNQMNTKREVLRLIASVFDPCGFVVQLVLPAKIFLQRLWSEKVHWDTPLKEDALHEWRTIIDTLDYIKYIAVPRHYETCLVADNEVEVIRELHCFTDASLQAYAAVVYMRSTYKDRNVVSFIIGKSRLVERAEQSNLQIPKLELLGVVIGSRLLRYVMKFLRLNILNQYLWTDSQIVLNWCTSEKLLPPFISKRVDNIKQNRELRLRYVPTQINPADVATKCSDSWMNDMKRWLTGPDFLTRSIHHWPKNATEVVCSQISSAGEGLSETPEVQDQNNVIPCHGPYNEYSGIVDSPVVEANMPGNVTGETASLKEFSILPEDHIEEILRIQLLYFPKETRGESTDLKRSLGLFLDTKGILRCGGRFQHADWPENQKHPILLPKDDQFTIKIIEKIHVLNYHVGVSHTLSAIRLHYWVPHGRSQVQKVLRRCQACRKQGGGPFKLPPMAQLPPERVRYQEPFSFVGIDYFGPLTVETKGSNEKRWVCLYTCLAVRAIHLEVVQELTAEQCLLALRRFISTRGTPKMIMSDNALQFKLTSDVLINGYCIERGIKWKFIPELAPWFGGFYERLIGIVKSCLKRTLEKHILNDTQLCTIMKEVEAVVNSRPLTFVGSEPEHILTPADFLRNGGPLVMEATEEEFVLPATATKASLIEGWKRGQRILQEYVMMFKNNYLTSLRDRKHSHRQPRVVVDTIPKVGDTVQIKGDSNRSLWKVGKICAVIKGSDGQIRVAKVATSPNETLTRSIAHLYPLEVSDTEHKTPPALLRESDQLPTPPENNRTNIEPQFAQATVRETNDSTTSGVDASPSRPRRLAAQKARDKVKEWTSQLLFNVRCIPNDDIVI